MDKQLQLKDLWETEVVEVREEILVKKEDNKVILERRDEERKPELFTVFQEHWLPMQSMVLKTDSRKNWNFKV